MSVSTLNMTSVNGVVVCEGDFVELMYSAKERFGQVEIVKPGKCLLVKTSEGYRTFDLTKISNLKVVV